MIKFRAIADAVFLGMLFFLIFVGLSVEAEAAGIQVFEKEKRIEIDGEISTELDRYADTLGGAMEYLAVSRGGKEYESIIVLECEPIEVYDALIKLGLEKGKPASFEEDGTPIMPTGDPVRLFLEWKDKSGKTIRIKPEDMIYSVKTKKRMQYVDWPFTGSEFGYFDPESDDEVLQASVSKNVISLHHGDQSVILQNSLREAADEQVPYRLFSDTLKERIENRKSKGAPKAAIQELEERLASIPKAGTKVKLIIDANNPLMQIHAFVSGDVQGVNFRNFTTRNARRLGVKGYVKNLDDGRVEVVAEGHKFKIDRLVNRIRTGPRMAKVEDVKLEELPFSGEYEKFEVVQ